jgi:hypothetical protein
MGSPCDDVDMDVFYAASTMTIGNGKIAPFWNSSWLNGRKPKDIAPVIYEASTRKKWKINHALLNNGWIAKNRMDISLSVQHIHEYILLWVQLNDIHLNDEANDYISWNLTPNGQYSTTSAYNAQFLAATHTTMNKLVWKAWAPTKINFFHGWYLK